MIDMLGDWNEDGIADEDGSVSSLSEVAQVEDMEHQPGWLVAGMKCVHES